MYRKLTTKWDLFQAMTEKGTALVELAVGADTVRGILSSVQREDGSGSSFNLTITRPVDRGSVTFHHYFRTTD